MSARLHYRVIGKNRGAALFVSIRFCTTVDRKTASEYSLKPKAQSLKRKAASEYSPKPKAKSPKPKAEGCKPKAIAATKN
jgi:hypothetical protein